MRKAVALDAKKTFCAGVTKEAAAVTFQYPKRFAAWDRVPSFSLSNVDDLAVLHYVGMQHT
jgi:hypothetical protein